MLLQYTVVLACTAILVVTLPTVVIVPGAFHSPWHWQDFMVELSKIGFPVSAVTMPDLNSTSPENVSVTDDITCIRDNYLFPLLNDGKEIILMSHSWGGSAGGAAADGLSKVECAAKGQSGGIIGLIFIAAFLARKNESLWDAVGEHPAKLVLYDDPIPGNVFVNTSLATNIFYNDLPAAVADSAVAHLLPISQNAMSSPSPSDPGWLNPGFQGKLAWIYTLLDNFVLPATQDAVMTATGVNWDVKAFNTSHSVYMKEPKRLVETVRDLARLWVV